MSPKRKIPSILLTAVLLLCTACDEDTPEMKIASLSRAVVSAETYTYLHCNSTGWQPSPETRLVPDETGSRLSLTFDVDAADPDEWWIVNGLDQCFLFQTDALDAWGTQRLDYEIVGPNPLTVGTSVSLRASTSEKRFNVDYSDFGTYKAVLDQSAGTFTIEAADAGLPPTATFRAECDRLECRFFDSSSDPDGNIASWSWSFGDGGVSSEKSPAHRYGDIGTVTVTLTVTDDDGKTDTASRDVVLYANPRAALDVACDFLSCRFKDRSSDDNGTVVSRVWTFDDGETSTETAPSHDFAAAGVYIVQLTVTDDDGETDTASHYVPLDAPSYTAPCDPSLAPGEICMLDDMESGDGPLPDGWTTDGWKPYEAVFTWESGAGIDGSKAIAVEHPTSNDSFFKRSVELAPDTTYELWGWIRVEDVVIGPSIGNTGAVLFDVTTQTTSNDDVRMVGTEDWKQVSVRFTTDGDGNAEIGLRLGHNASDCVGKAWFDEVAIYRPMGCEPMYDDGHFQNDSSDENRFNIVFVPDSFTANSVLYRGVKRMVGADPAYKLTGAWGLMEIPPFSDHPERFNFWVSGDEKRSRDDRIAECQAALPNRVIPIYPHPAPGSGGSWGRSGADVEHCEVGQPGCDPIVLFQGAIHEMFHTIPCFADEYVNTDLDWDVPTEYELNIYPTDDYEDCLADAPWGTNNANLIGNGCGAPGVIDCFNETLCPLPIGPWNEWNDPSVCCIPGTDCQQEIGCFEGARYKEHGVWRPTVHGIMRSHYWYQTSQDGYFSEWHRELMSMMLDKGPAVGQEWYPGGDFGMDCNLWHPTEFAP